MRDNYLRRILIGPGPVATWLVCRRSIILLLDRTRYVKQLRWRPGRAVP